jgi:hypothetical protein
MLKELLTRLLGYSLGFDKPFTYEIADGCIFQVSASSRRQMFVLNEIQSWRRNAWNKSVSVYQADCTTIIGDSSDQLGSLLEREFPEHWIIQDEVDS